jgi:hypothetical protein
MNNPETLTRLCTQDTEQTKSIPDFRKCYAVPAFNATPVVLLISSENSSEIFKLIKDS